MKRLGFFSLFVLAANLSYAQSGSNCSNAIDLISDTTCNAQSFSTAHEKWFSFSPNEEHVSIYVENDHECGTNTPHIHCLDAFGGTCSGLDTLASDELAQFDGAKELDIDLSGLDTSETYYIKVTPEARFRECPRGGCPDVGSSDFNICLRERQIRFPEVSHPMDVHPEPTADAHGYVTNEGQVEDTDGNRRLDIKAYSRNSSPKVYIGDTLNSFVFSRIDTGSGQDSLRRIDMELVNAKEGEVFRTGRKESHLNFYRPGVVRGVPQEDEFDRVVKDEVYDGIDLHYSSNSQGLKMYFVVEPGADPSDIRMLFENPGTTSITGNNGLRLETDLGALSFKRAHVYRINPAGNIVPMPPSGDFVHHGNDEYGIDVGNYPDLCHW